jgi:hypothetical protein
MSKNKNKLFSTIKNPGQEFIIGEEIKDTMYLPNSMLMSSFILGVDEENPNIGFHQVVMFRRGKSGKPSLKVGTLLSPIYHIEGIPFDELYPGTEDRKYFVMLENPIDSTLDITKIEQSEPEDLEAFIVLYAWLLSKAKFLKALDSKSHQAENETASILGGDIVNRPKVIGKFQLIKNVISIMEESVNHERPADTWSRFISDGKLNDVLLELRAAEHMLAVPSNYYTRSIYNLMGSSLTYLKNKVNKLNGPNRKKIVESIIEEQKKVNKVAEYRNKTNIARLKRMKNNQMKLTAEDIF